MAPWSAFFWSSKPPIRVRRKRPPDARSCASLQHLRGAGWTFAGDVGPWDSYGWSFAARRGEALIECMIQRSDAWLLMCWAHRRLIDRLRGRSVTAELERFQSDMLQGVGRLTGASGLHWRTEEQWRREA